MTEHPAEFRDLAVRYRRIAAAMTDPQTVKALKDKARQFDDIADKLEERGEVKINYSRLGPALRQTNNPAVRD